MKREPNQIVSPRSAHRVVDMPEWYGGGYDLVTGIRTGAGDYSKSPWASACMKIRATELAALPWQITRNGVIVEDHPLVEMLTKFGKESNYSTAVRATEIDQLLGGAAFWLHDIDILERLNPKTIKVVRGRGGIKHFEQKNDQGEIVNRFGRDEVVYFREYHPEDDLGPGTPDMEFIKLAISNEYEASLYVDAFFKNDATPSLLLTTEQTVAEPEMNKVLAWWNKRFRRGAYSKKSRAHKVSMADRGLKAQILSTSLRDIALVEIRDQARSDICTGFRVPKILVGSMEDATYANAQEARRFMIEDLIIPRSKIYQDTVNADLVDRLYPGDVFEFVTDQLPILQESATEKWERLDKAIQRGAISVEFARQQMGWPESAAPAEQPIDITSEIPALDTVKRAWRRKATKAFKRGESPDVIFDTVDIPAREQLRIHDRLADAGTAEEITRAFLDD